MEHSDGTNGTKYLLSKKAGNSNLVHGFVIKKQGGLPYLLQSVSEFFNLLPNL
jgi:hypothetical protein